MLTIFKNELYDDFHEVEESKMYQALLIYEKRKKVYTFDHSLFH